MKYSNLAHIPWAIGVQLLGVALFYLSGYWGLPAFWICGLGGWAVMVGRDEAKEEYAAIALRFGGLRVNMPDLFALQFWKWSAHNLLETAYAGLAAAAVALAAQFVLF